MESIKRIFYLNIFLICIKNMCFNLFQIEFEFIGIKEKKRFNFKIKIFSFTKDEMWHESRSLINYSKENGLKYLFFFSR